MATVFDWLITVAIWCIGLSLLIWLRSNRRKRFIELKQNIKKEISMSTQTAKDCFEENINLFSDPNKTPEKHNLYTGLYSLAEAIQRIEGQLQQIQSRQ
jgi:hypothetical protein